MTINPVMPQHGDTIRFHRDLYTALRSLGFSHPEIKATSPRAAFLLYFHSPEAVDAHLGEGTYRAVQQSHGGLGSWRKQWKRAIAEHDDEYLAQCAALAHLQEATHRCLLLGASDQEIRAAFMTALTPIPWLVSFEPPQQLPQAH